MKVFCSWSGGKDCCLACYEAISEGFEVTRLLNMISQDGERSRSHGLRSELIRAQSEAVGIPVLQRGASWESYETEFKKAISQLKREGIEGGVFGDIDLDAHREWIERVCAELSIKPILPLWRGDREKLLRRFIELGFEAIVVAVKEEISGLQWLGRKVDEKFLDDAKRVGIDLCGEEGEYHTFVIDGPIFLKRIKVIETEKVKRGERIFLDILSYRLEVKG